MRISIAIDLAGRVATDVDRVGDRNQDDRHAALGCDRLHSPEDLVHQSDLVAGGVAVRREADVRVVGVLGERVHHVVAADDVLVELARAILQEAIHPLTRRHRHHRIRFAPSQAEPGKECAHGVSHHALQDQLATAKREAAALLRPDREVRLEQTPRVVESIELVADRVAEVVAREDRDQDQIRIEQGHVAFHLAKRLTRAVARNARVHDFDTVAQSLRELVLQLLGERVFQRGERPLDEGIAEDRHTKPRVGFQLLPTEPIAVDAIPDPLAAVGGLVLEVVHGTRGEPVEQRLVEVIGALVARRVEHADRDLAEAQHERTREHQREDPRIPSGGREARGEDEDADGRDDPLGQAEARPPADERVVRDRPHHERGAENAREPARHATESGIAFAAQTLTLQGPIGARNVSLPRTPCGPNATSGAYSPRSRSSLRSSRCAACGLSPAHAVGIVSRCNFVRPITGEILGSPNHVGHSDSGG